MRILLLQRQSITERDDDTSQAAIDAFLPRLQAKVPGLDVAQATRVDEAILAAVESRHYDIVIVAQDGAGVSADEDWDAILAPLVNLRATAPRVPLLYLALEGNEWLAAAAIKYGASDYLPLPRLEDHVLIRAIKECLAGGRLPTKSKAKRRSAEEREQAAKGNGRGESDSATRDPSAPKVSAPASEPKRLKSVKASPSERDFTREGLANAPDIPGYRIVRLVGEGGTATTYLALDERRQRHVVIKFMPYVQKLGNLDNVRVFKREYEVIASLNDRRVVKVFDSGVREDGAYLVVEYFAGGDLGRRMRRAMSTHAALHYARGIAQALKLIHSHGIYHRDLKPGNVMLREDGSVALIDFGLAKLPAGQTLAQAGRVLGTPSYLSPEQGTGAKVDGSSDIYSLGCVLFEMLAGRRPYLADSAVRVIDMHVRAPVPDLPGEVGSLQGLINRMMAKDKADRYATADEVIEAIDEQLRDLPFEPTAN
ncbi:MAG: protein kinase [Pseudomonadota bacterium]